MSTASSFSFALESPAARDYIARIARTVSVGRNSLVLLPSIVPSSALSERLSTQLRRQEIDRREVHVSTLPLAPHPLTALALHYGVLQGTHAMDVPSIRKLKDSPLVSEVTVLYGLEEIDRAACDEWLLLLNDWARLPSQDCLLTRLLVVFAPGNALAGTDQFREDPNIPLNIHTWWMIPSSLESRLACRQREGAGGITPEGAWREHILPGLSCGDFVLVDYLWDAIIGTTNEIIANLHSYGVEIRQWTRTSLIELGAEDVSRRSKATHALSSAIQPTDAVCSLWADGAVACTPEFGVELHAAALALLRRDEDVMHRLWRGQAALLLPLIDNVRLEVCRAITADRGKEWPLCVEPRFDEDRVAISESPLACDLGHLKAVLMSAALPSERNKFGGLVHRAHYIRNQLAHYHPVEFLDFDALVEAIVRARLPMPFDV